MKTLELSSGEGFFDPTVQLPGRLLDRLGTLQVGSLVRAYGLGARQVLSKVKNAQDSEDFLQVAFAERLHGILTEEQGRWRSLGISYLEVVNLDFCLEATQARLSVPYRPRMDLVKNLARDRGIAQFPNEAVNLGRSTFDEKFDELLELLPRVFFEALRTERFFITGAVVLDNYVADMVTTLKSMRGNS